MLTFEVRLVLRVVERDRARRRVHVLPLCAVDVSLGLLGLHLRAPLDLELGDVEAVHVVHVRVEAARERELVRERLAAVAREAGHAELEPGLDEAHVRPLAERVVDDGLVLVDGDGAGRVDEEAARLGVCLDAVDRAEDELLLEMREEREVALRLDVGCVCE